METGLPGSEHCRRERASCVVRRQRWIFESFFWNEINEAKQNSDHCKNWSPNVHRDEKESVIGTHDDNFLASGWVILMGVGRDIKNLPRDQQTMPDKMRLVPSGH
jgi:hypothetical protein